MTILTLLFTLPQKGGSRLSTWTDQQKWGRWEYNYQEYLGDLLLKGEKRANTIFIVVSKVDYLWFPSWEPSVACRNASVVGKYVALAFTSVDYVAISHDKEYPETVHEYTGHQAKPAHDSDRCNAGVIVGNDLYYNVYRFIKKDPNDVDHQTYTHLGIYWVYEEAADDDGDERQAEDDIKTPTDDQLLYQDIYTLVPFDRAIAAPHVLLFEDEVHVRGYDSKNSWQHGAHFGSHPTPVFLSHAENSCEDK